MVLAGEVLEKELVMMDDGVTDYKGNVPDKSKTGGWLGAGLILGAELAERICIVGIAMNLVTYLVGDLHLSNSKSANVVTNFMGSLHIFALVGGFLADAKLGRYTTVAVFGTVTALGVTMLTVATSIPSMRPPVCDDFRRKEHECIPANGGQKALLYASLYLIALGAGSLKANVSGFGSDQFDGTDPKEEKAMVFFFNRFYFSISFGSLFAVTVLVYIQDNVGRNIGYGISAAAMAVAVLVLLLGTTKYRYKKPQGSPFAVIWRVAKLAWDKRRLPFPTHPSELHQFHASKVAHTNKFRCLDKAAIEETPALPSTSAEAPTKPVRCSTVTEVEEVKMVIKLLPIWSTCILFWTVYSQMTTFSVEQATYMDRRVTGTFLIPSGSLPFFLFITILLFTSLNEKLLVPVARTITGNPTGITSLQRVAVGLILAMLAMGVSAVVEDRRRYFAVQHKTRISAFWLVPQYFLVGAGEAFAYVGQLEFFIREAPERMKSMSTGLFLTTLAMGYFISSLLVSIVGVVTNGSWIKNNLNNGRLDYFYCLLAVLGFINFLVFLFLASKHEYKVRNQNNWVEELKEEKELKEEIIV